MKNIKRTLSPLTAAALALGCFALGAQAQSRPQSGVPAPRMLERPQLAGFEEPKLEAGSPLVAHELAWVQPEPQVAARRLLGAMEALLGKDAAAKMAGKEADYEALRLVVAKDNANRWGRFQGTPVVARYDAAFDEIRLIHEEREAFLGAGRDIGVEGAQKAAEGYLQILAEKGVIDPRLYKEGAMQLGFHMVGEGSVEEEVGPGRVVGYRITYRPRLDGFQLANAGLRLGILASGELASLRVGGVTPVGKESAGAQVRRVRTTTDDVMKRFYRDLPRGVEPAIAWSRVMYVLPEGKSRAMVEPMMLVSFTEQRRVGEESVASRRRTLAYSLTSPEAPPIDFDAPAAKHEGVAVTRDAAGSR